MKYTNPRLLLKVNEVDLYDLMLRTSRLLQETADGGIKELAELLEEDSSTKDLGIAGAVSARAQEGLHAMLTYAFTCGAAFAIERQVANAMKVVKDLQTN